MHILVNKDEEHDNYSIINVVSFSIQNFTKYNRMGMIIVTNWAHQFNEIPHCWVLPNFPISSLTLGIWRLIWHSHRLPGMYHLVGEASRCPNTICNTVSRRYYENVKREQTPGQTCVEDVWESGFFEGNDAWTQSWRRSRIYPSQRLYKKMGQHSKERMNIYESAMPLVPRLATALQQLFWISTYHGRSPLIRSFIQVFTECLHCERTLGGFREMVWSRGGSGADEETLGELRMR